MAAARGGHRSAGRRPGGCDGCAPTRCAGCTCAAANGARLRAMVRSSVPEPTPVQRAQVETAVRQRLRRGRRATCRAPWQQVGAGRGGAGRRRARRASTRPCVGTDLGVDRTPLWWRLGSVAAVAASRSPRSSGAVLAAACWPSAAICGCPTRRRRTWPASSLPTVLLVGGVLLGLLLALLGSVDRPRRGRAAPRRGPSRGCGPAIESVADRLVLGPVAGRAGHAARATRARARCARAAGRADRAEPAASSTGRTWSRGCPQISCRDCRCRCRLGSLVSHEAAMVRRGRGHRRRQS